MARSVNDRLQDETIAHGLYVTRYGRPADVLISYNIQLRT